MRYTVVYDAVKWPVTKMFTCQVCGRRGSRSKTFRQTINPFNKNAAGEPKTWSEIMVELQAAAEGWSPDRHERCES